MALFPRVFASEFAPMFRLLDDYASHAATRGPEGLGGTSTGLNNFTPRFDVKENKDSYELHGELPGVKREDLSIEFTDNHTINIKGRTEYHREEGTRPDLIESGPTSAGAIEGAPSTSDENNSGQYHKASVEDEDAAMSGANPEAEKTKQVTKHDHKKHKKHAESRYWVSERSVGTFSRSFQFPTRVDQDNVKASLQNGILSIVVPKASAPQAKRITVE